MGGDTWQADHRLCDESLIGPDVCIDLVSMTVVISQSCKNRRQRKARIGSDNFFGRHTHSLAPNGNVLNLDSMTEDMWFTATESGLDRDEFGDDGRQAIWR